MVKRFRRPPDHRTPTFLPGRGPRLRLGIWPTDPRVGHLVVLEHEHVPAPSDLDRIIGDARAQDLRAIRTTALFPDAAAVLLDRGFTPIDSLTLLRIPFDEPDQRHDRRSDRRRGGLSRAPVSDPSLRTRRLRVSDDAAAAEVDRLAFGPMWGYDRRTVTEVRGATPVHRARRIGDRRRPDAYAISGAGGTTGYIQRLAVRPDRHRCGLASALVADSLHWMRSRGLGSALVNTASDNHAALALYDRFGFRALPERLTVAELSLCTDSPTTSGVDPEPLGRI